MEQVVEPHFLMLKEYNLPDNSVQENNLFNPGCWGRILAELSSRDSWESIMRIWLHIDSTSADEAA